MKSLEHIKVGDKVVLHERWRGGSFVVSVTHVGRLYIRVKGTPEKFRRADGLDHRGFGNSRIQTLEAHAHDKKCREALAVLNSAGIREKSFRSIKDDVLFAVADTIRNMQAQAEVSEQDLPSTDDPKKE